MASEGDGRDVPAGIESPFCRALRSKRFFFAQGVPTDAAQYLDGSDHCWCFETQSPIGPDGGKVYPDRCTPGRRCYRSALE
jgi:hypothetical protein